MNERRDLLWRIIGEGAPVSISLRLKDFENVLSGRGVLVRNEKKKKEERGNT